MFPKLLIHDIKYCLESVDLNGFNLVHIRT